MLTYYCALEQIETGKALADHLTKLCGGMNKRVDDLKIGLNAVAATEKGVFTAMEDVVCLARTHTHTHTLSLSLSLSLTLSVHFLPRTLNSIRLPIVLA
jgi:hypothetical protein